MTSSSTPLPSIIIVIPSFYPSMEDTRFATGIETCRQAAQHTISVIMVDASPDENIRKKLREAGTANDGTEWVQVIQQTYKGRKGAAIREAVDVATQRITAADDDKEREYVVGFQEPEKADVMKHWQAMTEFLVDQHVDICVMNRSKDSFERTYPKEQVASETFGNMYLNALSTNLPAEQAFTIDWLAGPIAWRHKYSFCWSEYKAGDLWDAQICPYVNAVRWHGAKIKGYDMDYQHPSSMKQQEEGDIEWIEKRLFQLNVLFETVGRCLKISRKEYEAQQQHQHAS